MIFKKDSAILGLCIGIVIPIIFYFLQDLIIPNSSMDLFALVFNLPFFRYYLMNLKYEKTGKGILFATFIYGLIWVYMNQII